MIGPGGGGTMRRPAVSPHDPKFVVEGCDMTGAYVTRDSGQSWRMFSLGAPPSAFAFDPKNPAVIYAATAALWRSEDAGRTWSMVYPDPARNTAVHAYTDHADFVIRTDDPSYPAGAGDVDIHTVAVDPADSRHLAIAVNSASFSPSGLRGLADAAARLGRPGRDMEGAWSATERAGLRDRVQRCRRRASDPSGGGVRDLRERSGRLAALRGAWAGRPDVGELRARCRLGRLHSST